MAEPGNYTIQTALHLEGQDIISAPLHLKIRPPLAREEEHIAQDFFSDEVGRILTFNGSRFLTQGNDTLREVSERFSDRRAAIHADMALGNAKAREYKLLDLPEGKKEKMVNAHDLGGNVKKEGADMDESRHFLTKALTEKTGSGCGDSQPYPISA